MSYSDSFWSSDWAERRKRERRADAVQEFLATSTSSDLSVLRLALAEILAENRHGRSYGMGCNCGGASLSKKKKKRGATSCLGHVSETVKIARKALGLPALCDTPRVLPQPRPGEMFPTRKPKP
jgi:hypothetical protein